MPPKPSIHNFRANFRPLGFRSPRWQIVHRVLYHPANIARGLLKRFRAPPFPKPPVKG